MRNLLRKRLPPPPPGYYDIAPSCQVTNLSFLIEHFLGRRTDGVFVEVGAFDGYSWSNTSGLASAGWTGWYIEPVPEYAAKCRKRYQALDNITVEQLAIGATPGEVTLTVGNALSTSNQAVLDEFLDLPWARRSFANSYQVDVEQMTLTTFLSDRGIEDLNMLVVDVEGNEPAVFAGFDLERWRPTMMIVELADTHRDLVANRLEHEQVGRDIVEAKYRVVYKDATNTVFVDSLRWQ